MVIAGAGTGVTLQNLVLAVQNTVALRETGTAGAPVSFARSLGGAAGLAALSVVLTHEVAGSLTGGSSSAVANADATSQVFLVSSLICVPALLAVLVLPDTPLPWTLDLDVPVGSAPPDLAVPAPTTGARRRGRHLPGRNPAPGDGANNASRRRSAHEASG